ncbi:MAG: VWA domain-containing protein [Candidatus Eisenbacteria sp.]|nr:VWA domain-containing protein [Candidatus Eisenbacteria bacterium]
MRCFHMQLLGGLACVALMGAALPAIGQGIRPFAPNVIVPQTRVFPIGQRDVVEIVEVNAHVVIREQIATTTMEIRLENPTRRRLEAELIVPVPEGAVVKGFAFEGPAQEPTAKVLPRDKARRIYDRIVAQVRDPALLEFLGYNLVRSSVFPVEGRGSQAIQLIYEHLLPTDGHRVDYVLPRSESLDYRVPWYVSVRIESDRDISTVYSPTHRLDVERFSPGDLEIELARGARFEAGPFRLSYLFEDGDVTVSLFAYPDLWGDGGYFLLLAGTPARSEVQRTIKREVILVLDRSGSMSGEKIEQARTAALQIISGLERDETFNLIVYNDGVDLFASAPVVRSAANLRAVRDYIGRIRAQGGTNIHEALLTALRQKSTLGALPIVFFLTDGLPTIRQTAEAAIRRAVVDRNPQERRIFTFGVGVDVNTPLLDRIATATRARSTYVLPGEDVEVKVAQLLLLGRYTGDDPLDFRLTGNFLGRERTFRHKFDLDRATTRNAFVPRLWASRKIATLVDAIRQMGAEGGLYHPDPSLARDPRFRELVDEIVRLSTEFGILTEYTAFLAEEGSELSDREFVLHRAGRNFYDRAITMRSGKAAVGQSLNYKAQAEQKVLNSSNSMVFMDAPTGLKNAHRGGNAAPGWASRSAEEMPAGVRNVSFESVRQVNDRAFFKRQGRWVDSRILNRAVAAMPTKTIAFGSDDYCALALKLAQQGRPGSIALKGDILLEVDGESILVTGSGS